MSVQQPQSSISVAEYLEGEKDSPARHEYVDGQMYAKAGTSDRHNRIALNLSSRLDGHLNGGPCEVFIADMRVIVDSVVYYYPDVVVTCDPPSGTTASCAFAVTVQSTDLSLTQAAPPLRIQIGGEVKLTYTIGVKNTGPGVANGVVMTDTLPGGTTFVSASASVGSCSTPTVGAGGIVQCHLGILSAGASATLTVVVKVRPSLLTLATFTNKATVSADTFDPNTANNTATARTTVLAVRNN